MLKFLIESYRNKKNRPLSFFVNWIGLTLGLAAVIVIYLYVMQEMRHDRGVYTASMERVYRTSTADMGAIMPSGTRAAVEKMPEIEAAVRVMNYEQVVATQGLSPEKIMRLKILSADTTLFSVLPFRIVSGSQTPFQTPNEAIVSRKTARKLFDTEDVIGKTISINNQVPVQIVSVIEDVPTNSIFAPEVIIPIKVLCTVWNSNYDWMENNWGHWTFECYIKLNEGVNPTAFQSKLEEMVRAKITASWGNKYESEVGITPLQDVYFESDKAEYSQAKTVDKEPIMVMAFIALLVLIVAIVNYVNIYTARSTEVIRAMGVKSIMGARRAQLITFVIFDSVFITLLSSISAFLLAWGLEPFYFDIIGSNVSFHLTWDMVLALLCIPLVCGVISGIFPAIALTRMKPLDAIANRSSGHKAMGVVRNGLIILQFTIAIALIGSTLFINKQMKYLSEMDMGYNRENIVTIKGSNFLMPKFDALRSKLTANANILGVSLVKNSPVYIGEFATMKWGESLEEQVTANIMYGDENALKLLGVDIVEGDMITDVQGKTDSTRRYLINEKMAKIIRQQIPDVTFPFKQYAGVIKDFQHTIATEVAGPLVFASVYNGGYADAYIKISGTNLDETMAFIAQTFAEIYPNNLYEFDFLDQQFANNYRNEQLFRSRLLTFSILTVFISCLGLFALVAYSVQRRRKEIAIRKVYGSTIRQVLIMLTTSFLKWLFISFVLASPIIYYISTNWVSKYQFKTELSWWIFAVALLMTMFVAIATVLGQTYKAATENPAKNVKAE